MDTDSSWVRPDYSTWFYSPDDYSWANADYPTYFYTPAEYMEIWTPSEDSFEKRSNKRKTYHRFRNSAQRKIECVRKQANNAKKRTKVTWKRGRATFNALRCNDDPMRVLQAGNRLLWYDIQNVAVGRGYYTS